MRHTRSRSALAQESADDATSSPTLARTRGHSSSSLRRATGYGPSSAAGPHSQSSNAGAVSEADDARRSRFKDPGDALKHFRSGAQKVIHIHRSSRAMSLGAGAEPGVDPRRMSAHAYYSHITEDCDIEVVDYSVSRCHVKKFTNSMFIDYLRNTELEGKEAWAKVRWINIGGISWDVLSALALKYPIHPLALEDVFHQRPQARSRADYYPTHMSIRLLCHRIAHTRAKRTSTDTTVYADMPRSASPEGLPPDDEDDRTLVKWPLTNWKFGSRSSGLPQKQSSSVRTNSRHGSGGIQEKIRTLAPQMSTQQAVNTITVEELKRDNRVNVSVTPMYLLLFRDGTVITINADPDLSATVPILQRLQTRGTVLRTSADASLLLESVIDLVVDEALHVVDEYQKKILEMEHAVLLRPRVKTVRQLHIMSADLTSHMRTLEPLKTLVYGLRRYDVDRCAALISEHDPNVKRKADGKPIVKGFMSQKSIVYLADVYDHMDYILQCLDMFKTTAENLINYTFNTVAYDMNQVMRRLTLVTIICLPLTLLTGYFGMNFVRAWTLHDDNHSDVVFWIIGLPILAITMAIFLREDFTRAIHYCKKRWLSHRVFKSLSIAR